PPRGAGDAGVRVGHAVPARARVVVLPRSRPCRPGDAGGGGRMSLRPVKLPDVGEGVAEAELIEWHVAVGDTVTPESVLASVMTDKATVEISSPVAGTVTALHGDPGDVLAVGAPFVEVDTG